jgi:cysteinyl-tRNA synthetase
MHNGTLMVDGEKMSKSKGNFKTVGEEIERLGAPFLRFWLLSSHYRSRVDYTEESLQASRQAFERLRIAMEHAERYLGLPSGGGNEDAAAELERQVEAHRTQFVEAMDDDFNTPAALAALFGLATEMNRVTATATAQSAACAAAATAARELMNELTGVLGLTLAPARASAENDLTAPLMELILGSRQTLRKHKDFAAADEIRARLNELGIAVEDRPGGSDWRRS